MVNKTLITPSTKTATRYLIDRGLTPSNEVSIFVKNAQGRAIISSERVGFPIFDENLKFVGYSKRQLFENPQYPKYLLDTGVDKDKVMFNHHLLKNRPKKIMIVEGQIDALLAMQNLNIPVLAVLGSSLSRHHVESMVRHGVESVLVVGDNDKAGRKFAFGACDLLAKHDIFPYMGQIKGGYKDFGELKKFSWENINVLDYWEEIVKYADFPSVESGNFCPRKKVKLYEKLEALDWRGAGLEVLKIIGKSSRKIIEQVVGKYEKNILEQIEKKPRELLRVERYRLRGFQVDSISIEDSQLLIEMAIYTVEEATNEI